MFNTKNIRKLARKEALEKLIGRKKIDYFM
jgi:hypothetical protein